MNKRREFLKTTLLSGIGIAAAPASAVASTENQLG